jgi:glycosyltransferase involved in cell wall biosynthesis
MKTIVITGAYPPDKCGVGTYVSCLLATHEANTWRLFYKKDWKTFKIVSYIREILSLKPDKIILQYPTMRYGWSLLPHLLCFYFSLFTKIHFIVMTHEYCNLSPKAKLAMNIIIYSAKDIVVTNPFDKEAILKKNKRLNEHVHIIKLFPNIKPAKEKKVFKQRSFDAAYFGQVRPNKGIEDFLSEIQKCRLRHPGIRTAIIGQYNPVYYQNFFSSIEDKVIENNVQFILNKTSEEVAELLNDSRMLFLPFPDGCSERHGTCLDGLVNGCVVITTKGKYTTEALLKIAFFASSEKPMNSIFDDLIEMNEGEYSAYQERVKYFLTNEVPSAWSEVAAKYNEI